MSYRESSLEAAFLRGEAEAHDQVVRWVAQVLSGPRFRMLRSERVDLHQEVLGRVVQSLRAGHYDPRQELRIYVQSIARYTARDSLVSRLRLPVADEPLDRVDPAEDIEERLLTRQLADIAMMAISEDCREIFRKFFYEERSYAQIAGELGIPIGTLKSRLFRCLRRARDGMLREPSAAERQVEKRDRGAT